MTPTTWRSARRPGRGRNLASGLGKQAMIGYNWGNEIESPGAAANSPGMSQRRLDPMAVRKSTPLCRLCRKPKPREEFATIYPENGKPHRGTTCDDCRASQRPSDLPGEQWRPIVGLEGQYEVSDLGRVRRATGGKGTFAGRILAQHNNNKGYPCVSLHYDGGTHQKLVHRVVALAFLGPCPEGYVTHHKDGRRHDPTLTNLEYRTESDNVREGYVSGNATRRGFAAPGYRRQRR